MHLVFLSNHIVSNFFHKESQLLIPIKQYDLLCVIKNTDLQSPDSRSPSPSIQQNHSHTGKPDTESFGVDITAVHLEERGCLLKFKMDFFYYHKLCPLLILVTGLFDDILLQVSSNKSL